MGRPSDEIRKLAEGGGAGEFVRGAWLPLRGLSLLLRTPNLLGLAVLPAFLTLVATGVTLSIVLGRGDWVVRLLWAKPEGCDGCGFGTWLWHLVAVGAWYLAWAIAGLAVVSLVALVFARVVASPILDVLSQKTLRQLGVEPAPGVVPFGDTPLIPQILTSLWRSALRGLVLVTGVVLLWLLSLVPGVAPVATPLSLVWTALWLYVDTTIYPLQWVGDIRMAQVRELFRTRPMMSTGFLFTTTVLTLIPLAGLMTTPLAIAGACYLVGAAQVPRTPEGEAQPAATA